MADTVAGDHEAGSRAGDAHASATPLVPAAQRGRLVVRDRVVEQVARRAARDVDAVTRGRAGTWRSLAAPIAGAGDGTRVDVDRRDDRVGLTVHLAVDWPQSLPDTAAATREAVQHAVTQYAGLEVERTDVMVDVAPAAHGGGGAAYGLTGSDAVLAPAAQRPTRAPRAAVPACLLALALVGVGVVGVRDALVTTGVLTGTPWATSVADAVSGATPSVAVLIGGVVVALLGLWFVVASVRPRPKPDLEVSADSDVWMRPQDVARLARSAAGRVGGVSQLKATASRRSVLVTVTGRTGTAPLDAPITGAVDAALSGLASPPSVKVRMKTPTPPAVAAPAKRPGGTSSGTRPSTASAPSTPAPSTTPAGSTGASPTGSRSTPAPTAHTVTKDAS